MVEDAQALHYRPHGNQLPDEHLHENKIIESLFELYYGAIEALLRHY